MIKLTQSHYNAHLQHHFINTVINCREKNQYYTDFIEYNLSKIWVIHSNLHFSTITHYHYIRMALIFFS